MADDRRYQDDEVRAIIDRALKVQPGAGVTHEDLLAIGAGVGLSRAALENAAREEQEARLDDAAIARVVHRRRRGIAAHAFVFCALNAGLFLINFLTTPGQWWVLFSVVGWGLGLLLHAGFGLSSSVSPARLKRERRRLQHTQAQASPARVLAAPSAGVRLAVPAVDPGSPDRVEPRHGSADTDDSKRPSARRSGDS